MRLSLVRVDGFRCLSGIEWRPAEGLNVVLGPNESGKSSLAAFVEAMLFGVPGGAAGEALRPWAGGRFGGRLELAVQQGTLVIERDFGNGDFRCEELNPSGTPVERALSGQLRRGSSTALARRYREILSRHLGFADEALYRRSTYVPQGELVMAAADLDTAAAGLRSIASGGGSAYDRALEALDQAYWALTSEGDRRRTPGVLDEMREERSAVAARLREERGRARRTSQLRSRRDERTAELQKVKEDAKTARHAAELFRDKYELSRRRAALAEAERAGSERLAAADGARRLADELDRKLAASQDLAEADSRFPELVNRARTAHETVARLEGELERLQHRPRGVVSLGGYLGAGIVLMACGLASGGACALLSGRAAAAAAVAGAVLLLTGAAVTALVAQLRRRLRIEAAGAAGTAERLSAELGAARKELASSSAALMGQTGGHVDYSPEAMAQLVRRYAEYKELSGRREALENSLIGEEQAAELRATSAERVRELAVLDARLEQLSTELSGDDDAAQSLPARAGELEAAAARLEKEVHALDVELAGLEQPVDGPAALEEREAELQEAIRSQEARCRALGLAKREMSASIQEFHEGHVDRLAGTAGESLAEMTLGRYARVILDGETLRPSAAPASGQAVAEAAMSQGTRSALHLALRLAMAMLVSGGRALPLVLDDPLVDMDDERREATLRLLGSIAARTQVVLLTFDRRAAAEGATVLELGR